jgi:anion-transporting  ArsA/GET3 family ATPase
MDKRVLFVTGKGGVGKSTLAASVALAAALRGKRVLLVETHGSKRLPSVFGKRALDYKIQHLTRNLHHLSVTSSKALEEYIVGVIKIRALYKLVFRNRVMGPFMDAVPGLHELIQLGKVMDLERATERGRPEWDLIVVDAPATGHGLSMLNAPASMMELTRTGPFYENAKLVQSIWGDPKRTGLLLVTLPEAMPVNETLDLYARLGDYQKQLALCVLNEVHAAPATSAQWAHASPHFETPALQAAKKLADRHMGRVHRQEQARERLSALPCPQAELPFLGRRDLNLADITQLAEQIEGAL